MKLTPSRDAVAAKCAHGIQYSHSQIEEFFRCPRRWAYRKILKLDPEEDREALVYGNAGHAALEHIGKGGACQEAIQIALGELHTAAKGQPWFSRCEERLPYHIQGFCDLFLPEFCQKWYFLKCEAGGTETNINNGGHTWRGVIDLVTQQRGQNGGIGIFDYKFSSDMYASSLSQSLTFSHQLANYIMAEARVQGAWPCRVGYILLKKPKGKESVKNLVQDPNKYQLVDTPVSPSMIAFAMQVEENDRAIAQQMQGMYRLYVEHGLRGIDSIPACFGSCKAYNRMCGFASACHSGNPLHKQLKVNEE